MHALLAKEFRLVVHPATYMLVVLGALVLIPSWPYAVIILYGILVAFFNAQNAREMRDLSYSFALPVSRRDMVRARVLVMIIIELAMTTIMALCICLRPVLGIDAVAQHSRWWDCRPISRFWASRLRPSASSTSSSSRCISGILRRSECRFSWLAFP